MNRRRFLLGLSSLVAGASVALGTGAFTSVRANRAVSVTVAGDADAYLSFRKSGTSNDAYVDLAPRGQSVLSLTFDDTAGTGGSGVNDEAITVVRDMFDVINKGTQEVYVWVEDAPDWLHFFVDYPANGPNAHSGPPGESLGVGKGGVNRGDLADENGSDAPAYTNIVPGEELQEVGVWIDTTHADADDWSGEVVFVAMTKEEAESKYGDDEAPGESGPSLFEGDELLAGDGE